MKIAVVGSRGLTVPHLELYLPPETTEIVSGGAKGVDTCAREYALAHGLKLTEFLPDYRRFKQAAPIIRNANISNHSDRVMVFWDGKSRGTRYVILFCQEAKKPFDVYLPVDEHGDRFALSEDYCTR